MSQSESAKENGHARPEIVTLTDDVGRALPCYIEHSFDLKGQVYALLLPVDSPVEIFAWPENGDEEEPVPVEDAEIDEIFDIAKAVLEEQNLTLKRTAITLTVSGDLPDPEEEEFEESEASEEDKEDNYEELQWLASFYNEEQEYAIYTPLDPFFILARLNANGEPELLSNEELQHLEPMLPTLEGMIEDRLFNELE